MTPLRDTRTGVVACLIGFAIAAAMQLAAPQPGPPLYDGIITTEPYVFVDPAGNEPGGARWATSNVAATAGTSPSVVLRTPEHPPQAQLIAAAGALVLPAGTTTIEVSLTPVTSSVAPATGSVVGNVYRVAVTNQDGVTVTGQPGKQVTLALRDPGTTDLAHIERLSAGAWVPVATVSASVPGTYETTGVTSFGDFALVGTPNPGGFSPGHVVTGAAIVLTLLLVGIGLLRGRRDAADDDTTEG